MEEKTRAQTGEGTCLGHPKQQHQDQVQDPHTKSPGGSWAATADIPYPDVKVSFLPGVLGKPNQEAREDSPGLS